MASYGKFRAAILSKAVYGTDGVGYSTVMEDYPLVLGPDAVYDQVDILLKPWGRDPDGYPLFINQSGVDRWTATITQHGVVSSSAYVTPVEGTIPAVCLVIVQVSNAGSLASIDGDPDHFVLGVFNPDLLGDPLPPALQPYDIDVPMPSDRWTTLRNGLVALGMDGAQLDNWKANHPNATPREIGEAFKNFITAQNRAQTE